VHELEEIRHTHQREAIRYGADLRIGELEVQRLSHGDPVDLELVRAELERVERLKVELRLARLEAIEKGKALLSPEQRAKLSRLLGEREYPPLREQPPSEPTQDHPKTQVD
jgi:Spy/CpxP family protein refolding chaperone